MAAPNTSTTLAKLGYDGYRNTTLCNRFDNTYREWTTKTLAKRYGPLSISEEVFTQLLQDIRANGIHRTDESRHLAYHTLLINRAIGILKHLLRKEVKDAHERYVESERVTRQPTNRSEGSAARKALENEVLHIAYALLSDSFMETEFHAHFKPKQLALWRLYCDTDFSGKKTALLSGCSESKVSRIKAKVGKTIVALAARNIRERRRREDHLQVAS